jgi:hypothetical protein
MGGGDASELKNHAVAALVLTPLPSPSQVSPTPHRHRVTPNLWNPESFSIGHILAASKMDF